MEPAVIWDSQPDKNVSIVDHYRALPIYLSQLLRAAGGKGIIVVSPEIMAIIETSYGFCEREPWTPLYGRPGLVGKLFGTEIWVDPDRRVTSVSVFDKPNGQELSRMLVVNWWGRDWTVLDDLTRI